MSAFTNGFNFGFVSGMFNRMFGGFNPFCGFNFTPTFFMPTYNASVFTPYSIPSVNMSFQNFSMPAMNNTFDWSSVNTGNLWSSLPMGDSFSFSTTASSKTYSDSDTSNFSYDAEELKNKWAKKKPNLKLSQEFFNKVVQIAKRVQCDPNDLMGIMNIETAGTFSPTKTNPKSGAVGLIQFLPRYVSSYGTSISALKNMTAEEQLTYVEKYLVKNKQTFGVSGKVDAGTLYALVFTPAWAKKETLASAGQKEYDQNKLLDKNKDGVITKSDLGAYVKEYRA